MNWSVCEAVYINQIYIIVQSHGQQCLEVHINFPCAKNVHRCKMEDPSTATYISTFGHLSSTICLGKPDNSTTIDTIKNPSFVHDSNPKPCAIITTPEWMNIKTVHKYLVYNKLAMSLMKQIDISKDANVRGKTKPARYLHLLVPYISRRGSSHNLEEHHCRNIAV